MARSDGIAVLASGGGLATADGRRPEVAIVGGSPAGALVAAVLCQQFGCTTVSTPTGESVLALLRGEAPVDLVVIDLSVPDMDGIVTVQLIRALGSRGNLPVVALTNDAAEATGARARTAGFSGAVLKPYSPRELYTAMHAALSRTSATAYA